MIENSSSRKLLGHYSVLYFLLAAALAAYLPFSVMFLNESGISVTTIGAILSVNSLIALCVRPVWGFLSDSVGSVKYIFIFTLAMSVILLQFFPAAAGSTYIIAGLYLAVTVFFVTLNPLLDSWIVQGIRGKDSKGYGNIRIYGCIAFAVSGYLFGRIIQATSINSIFPLFGILGLATIVVAVRTPNLPAKARPKIGLGIFRHILSDNRYLLFLVFEFLLFVPLFSVWSYMPIFMESVGGTKIQYGMVVFIGSMCEIPIYLSGKYIIRKTGPLQLIFVAALLHAIRLLLFSFITEPFQIIALQSLNGVSLALFTLGILYYLDELAPPELKTTYLTISISISHGLSGILSGYLGGWIIDNYTIRHLMRLGSLLCLIAITFFSVSTLILFRRNRT